MYKATVSRNRIKIDNPDGEIMTSGSVNINFIEFTFSEDWIGLKKTVLFQTKKALLPVVLEPEVINGVESLVYTMAIPWEVLVYANENVNVGAYGTRFDDEETVEDESIVLPTVWGTIPDKIKQGVIVSDPIEPSPTYNAYLYLLQLIEELIEGGGGGAGTFDHALLKNRDAADQHPIDSITELSDFIVNTGTELSDISMNLQEIGNEISTLREAISGLPAPITDHNLLAGRTNSDAHPIASITGLEERLQTIENSTPSGTGGSGDIYDETERIVGFWFGKPYYRKTFIIKIPRGDYVNAAPMMTYPEYMDIQYLYVRVKRRTGAFIYNSMVTPTANEGYAFHVYVKPSINVIGLMCGSLLMDELIGQEAVITIMYTKTTDPEVTTNDS